DVAEEPLVARDHHCRGPFAGSDTEQAELERQERGVARYAVYVGVDAIHERADYRGSVRVIGCELALHAPAVHEEARPAVALELSRAEYLGHGSRGLAAPELELEQPVVRRVVALREEEVVLVSGVDVRDPPPVADYLDGLQ